MVRQWLFKGSVELRNLRYLHYQPKLIKVIYKDMPYFSQWESINLVKDFLSRKLLAKEDPNWKKSGAKSKEEYEKWSWNSCGIACLKSILFFGSKKEYKIVELAKLAQKYGCYIEKVDKIDGLFYKPFIKFLKDEFGLSSKIIAPAVLPDILLELEKGNFVIASVNPGIRSLQIKYRQTGGHLILMVGFDWMRKLLLFHNPSGDSPKTQAFVRISFENFSKFFASRMIVIKNSSGDLLS